MSIDIDPCKNWYGRSEAADEDTAVGEVLVAAVAIDRPNLVPRSIFLLRRAQLGSKCRCKTIRNPKSHHKPKEQPILRKSVHLYGLHLQECAHVACLLL